MVWYKKPEKEKGRNKLEPRWQEGIWLGHARSSNEVLIGTNSGVIKVYACKRRPADERWNEKAITEMQGLPQRPNPQQPGLAVPIRIRLPDVHAEPPEPHVERAYQPRRRVITHRELEKYGSLLDAVVVRRSAEAV